MWPDIQGVARLAEPATIIFHKFGTDSVPDPDFENFGQLRSTPMIRAFLPICRHKGLYPVLRKFVDLFDVKSASH